MGSREQIERLLLENLEKKRAAYDRAKEIFHEVASGIPSGLPHPDGQERIRAAARVNAAALDGALISLREFNDFILNGIVPEHLSHLRPPDR